MAHRKEIGNEDQTPFYELAKHLSAKCISKNYAITVYVDSERLHAR